MLSSRAVLVLLLLWGAMLSFIAARCVGRVHSVQDFFIASRRVDVVLTALAHAGSTSSAWILMGVGAAAYTWGLSALWLWFSLLAGYALNWLFIAPRLHALAVRDQHWSVMHVLSSDPRERMHRSVAISAAIIVIGALLLQAGAQLQFASELLRSVLNGRTDAIGFLSVLVLVCMLLGGFWAAAYSDAVHALALLLVALLVAAGSLNAVGGYENLRLGLLELPLPLGDWLAGRSSVVALALVLGILGIGFGSAGQVHAAQHLMAARTMTTILRARWIALAWIAIVTAAMLVSGWSAKLLVEDASYGTALSTLMRSKWMAGMALLIVIWTLVSSTGGQMLAAASALALDFRRTETQRLLVPMRWGLVAIGVLLVAVFLLDTTASFDRVLLGWEILGASFGPLLIVRLGGKHVRAGSSMGAMWAGTLLTLIFYAMPDSPGDFLERVLPFVAALGVALTGGELHGPAGHGPQTHETVHDRLPI